jgi:XRE family transcriptional regulator of biofilm formation
MAHVGGRIRTLRAERGMTLDQLAKLAGVSKGLLSKLENNPDSNPSLDTIFGIAQAMELTLSDLLDSGAIQAKRLVPDEKPAWVDAIAAALKADGEKPDEDILQALYVLQTRKGEKQKSDVAWVHMYRSLELNFQKSRSS